MTADPWTWACTACSTELPVATQADAFDAATRHLVDSPACEVEVGEAGADWPAGILYLTPPDRSPAPLRLRVLNRLLGGRR